MTALDFALDYAARGWRVHPCRPQDKRPILRGWQERSTTDPAQIRGWWAAYPDANIGIATGTESGLLVLDLDSPNPRRLLDGRAIPRTPTQRTGGGGYQLFLTWPAELPPEATTTRTRILDAVDTRGRGGYVVAPPSVHPNGPVYRWIKGLAPADLPLADPPGWLVQALRPAVTQPRSGASDHHQTLAASSAPARYVQAAIEAECMRVAAAVEGERNATLNRAAYSLARFVAMGKAAAGPVRDALVIAARATGLNDGEAGRTIDSGFSGRGVPV